MPFRIKNTLSILLLLLLLVPAASNAQKEYPGEYFRSPMDIRLLLSGTFGELRSNHFHSGIDIKTNGAPGQKIYAIADGYISRINVSTYGFGKALYINHPNGYTSVYAHLDYFTGPIHDYVIEEHYSRESFEMTLYPSADRLPVRKGDVIAYSGNSGSSMGPHLHFEVRDAATQVPINPLHFGFDVKDFYRPRITRIKIYAADEHSLINGKNKHLAIPVEGWGENHRLSTTNPVRLSGSIGFGVQCYDQQNDTPNKNGVYSIKVFLDKRLISATVMDEFSFGETRYINSLIDYEEYMASKARIQRTEIDPGNKLSIYEITDNRGLAHLDDDLTHEVRIEVTDIHGNLSLLEFTVQGEKAASSTGSGILDQLPFDSLLFNYNGINRFNTGDFVLEAPAGAFYRSFRFSYEKNPAPEGAFASLHKVHNKFTPVHEAVTIALKPDGMDEALYGKALVVRVDDPGNVLVSAGGEYHQDGFVRTKIREFGNYSVSVDTVPPLIVPLDEKFYKDMALKTTLRFRIRDELAGIKSYRGTLNGRWILMEYDAKNDLLFYHIDDRLEEGPNPFRLEVSDMKDNIRIYETVLVR